MNLTTNMVKKDLNQRIKGYVVDILDCEERINDKNKVMTRLKK